MVVVGLVPLVIGWSHMPDPVATHWGIDGAPNGYMPLLAVPLLVVFAVSIGLVTSSLFRIEGRPTAEAFAMVGLLGGLGVFLMTSLVYLNWDVPTWEEAGPVVWWHILGIVAGAAVGGLIGYSLGKRWHSIPVNESHAVGPVVRIPEGEVVSWVGSCSVRWPLLILGPFAVVFFLMRDWWMVMGLVFIVLALLFSRVFVFISDHGFDIRLGGGIRARRIAIDDVQVARAIDLEPAAWGGWGWRVKSGASAIVLRRGDAIEVTFESGRRFAVTVDDAATGAALLNGLVARLARKS
jgi:hypothetical protein